MRRMVLMLALVGGGVVGCGGARQATLPPSPVPTVSATVRVLPPTPLPATPTAAPTEVPTEELVALVNGAPIPRKQWERQVERVQRLLQSEQAGPSSPVGGAGALGVRILDEMVDEMLIRQAAAARGIAIPAAQLDERIAQDIASVGGQVAFDEQLAGGALSLDEYRAATETELLASAVREQVTREIAPVQPQVHLRHILLPTKEEAEATLAELESGADFATLAQARSVDPGSQPQGGDLGWLPRGLLPPSVDEAVWQLGPGERSGILRSDFGFHIVEVLEQDPARPLPLELLQLLQQQRWEQWLARERAAATIETWLTP